MLGEPPPIRSPASVRRELILHPSRVLPYHAVMHWIIGDIHGMVQPLATLLLQTRKHDSQAQFLFVGDYVNRGQDSRNVIELLIRLGAEGAGRFCRGNHDDVFDLLLNGTAFCDETAATDPVQAFGWFMQFGLGNTLLSYGVEQHTLDAVARRPSAGRIQQLLRSVPNTHRAFIRALPPVLDEKEFVVAHAHWDLHAANDATSLTELLATHPELRHRLIWDRFSAADIAGPKWWSRPMFFGHTPVVNYPRARAISGQPLLGPGIALIDTGAAVANEGRLTAFCFEAGAYLQADRDGRLLTPQPVEASAGGR